MKKVLFIVICLVTTVGFSQSEIRYYVERGHFSFDVPTGWQEIPIEVVKAWEGKLFKQGMEPKLFKLEAAFQKQSEQYLTPPFLTVSIGDLRGVHEAKVEKVFKSAQGEGSAQEFLAVAKNSLVPEVYESMRSPNVTYDRKRHILLTRCEMVLPEVGECVDTDAVILGKDICANLDLIGSMADFENDQDTFNLVLESFAFDEGYEFRPGPVATIIAKAVKVGWIGAIVVVVLCLLRHLWQHFI